MNRVETVVLATLALSVLSDGHAIEHIEMRSEPSSNELIEIYRSNGFENDVPGTFAVFKDSFGSFFVEEITDDPMIPASSFQL